VGLAVFMFPSKSSAYEAVPHQDFPDESQQKQRQHWRLGPYAHIHILLYLSAFITIIVLSVLLVISRSKPDLETHNCGSSPEEARNLGCHYESNSLSWIPNECYAPEVDEAWDSKYEFKYYNDSRGELEIPRDIVAQGETNYVHVSWKFHLTHCLFVFRKLFHAAVEGDGIKGLDSSVKAPVHFYHCLSIMMDRHESFDSLETVVGMTFQTC